jgi:hypothetical protein
LFVNPKATEEDLQLALKNQAVPLFWNVLKTELNRDW